MKSESRKLHINENENESNLIVVSIYIEEVL